MDKPSTSLIKRNSDQSLLWSTDDLPAEVISVESVEGHYSGDRLFSQRPAVYRAIVYLLGCGVPRKTIAEKLCVHHKTVAVVAIREGGSIATQKKETAAMVRHGRDMVVDSLVDDIANGVKVPTRDKAIIAGILTDIDGKLDPGSGFDGDEFDGSTPGHDEYQEFLDGLGDSERTALVKMGRAAEKRATKESAATPVIGASSAVYDGEDSL